MSAVVQQVPVRRGPSNTPARIRLAIQDGLVVARRNLVSLWRVPTVLVFELVQPIMFVLLFRFIYANQFKGLGGLDYVQFLMPGIFVQNAIFGATTTAIGLADDLKKGLIDRFRSLPMARSAVLAGRTTSDLAKNFLLVLIVMVIGYLVGFRFTRGVVPAVGLVVLVLAVGFVFSWICACIGLWLKVVEAVQAAVFTIVFPIVFVSSAFVPGGGHVLVAAADRAREPGHGVVQPRAVPREREPRHHRRHHEAAGRHVRGPPLQVGGVDHRPADRLRAARDPSVPQARLNRSLGSGTRTA